MWAHRVSTVMLAALVAGFGPLAGSVAGQNVDPYPLEARVWLDRGQEPVLQRGETARLYYRVSEDAFVAIFHIDTNGTIRMVFPNSPQENHFARGGRDYRVLFPGSSYWYVNDDPGMGYFFLVASPEPFDLSDLGYSHYDGGWDLGFVGRQVYRDPYLAMDDYVAALIPQWEYIPYGLDFTSYSVDQRFEYPRFMCYDCHGFRPYNVWNPYHYSCSTFRVVIYNDPYYYPVTRYRGTRVVYTQPRSGVPHFSFKERVAGEPGTPQVVVRPSTPRSQPGVEGTDNRRAQPRGGSPAATLPSSVGNRAVGGSSGATIPGVAGSAARRPSSTRTGTPSPIVTPRGGSAGSGQTGATGGTATGRPILTPPTGGGTSRPVLERRPGTGSTAVPRTTPPKATRPSAKVKRGGGGGESTVPSLPPRTNLVRPPAGSGGSPQRSGSAASGGSGATVRPTVRSGGSSTAARPPARASTPQASPARPPARSGGTAARPPARPSTPQASPSRPPARSGGTAAARPPARSGGTAAARPPVVKRRGGGG